MKPLSLASLGQLPPSVAVPGYDPRPIAIGIVHLGIGAFHRAQTAVYSDDALALEGGAWGICGVSLRTGRCARPSRAAGRFVHGRRKKSRRCTAARHRQRARGAVSWRCTATPCTRGSPRPSTRIISLTITEKGYCHDPATGALNFAHPDIVHDLADPARPQSAIGLIVAALAARRRAGDPAVTVLCCDNLPHNGALVRGLILAFAAARDAALARWIEDHVRCPSTMVDRIVPATTSADTAENDTALGVA